VTHKKQEDEIALATVTARDDVRYIAWPSSVLRTQLAVDQRLSLQMVNTFSLALVNKLRASRDDCTHYYGELLQVVTADGRVPPEEKRAVREYRRRHKVTPEEHDTALVAIGWSQEEWEDGALERRPLGAPAKLIGAVGALLGWFNSG